MTSFDCTVGMNVQWVDFTAILDLNSVQGSSLRGHMIPNKVYRTG